jgi:hypothetical protein
MESEPTIPAFEQAKRVHAIDHLATVIASSELHLELI